MKTALSIIGTLLGIGVVIYLVKAFQKPATPNNAVVNTGTAGALDPFYKLFGLTRTPNSTGQGDQTGQIITAGASAFTGLTKSFASLFGGTPMTTPTLTNADLTLIGNGITSSDPIQAGTGFVLDPSGYN